MNAAFKAIVIVVLATGGTVRQAGCDHEQPAASPPPASPVPVVTPSPTPVASPPPEPPDTPIALEGEEKYPIREGWVQIKKKADPAKRAWVEGSVVGGDKIVITTDNVRRFQLDLTRLRVDWKHRVVLRMDGFNSELTRKRWPVVQFARTPSGAWSVVED